VKKLREKELTVLRGKMDDLSLIHILRNNRYNRFSATIRASERLIFETIIPWPASKKHFCHAYKFPNWCQTRVFIDPGTRDYLLSVSELHVNNSAH
jgi:hypothetical protein